jgi:4'-phosphopantetheinyl transferase
VKKSRNRRPQARPPRRWAAPAAWTAPPPRLAARENEVHVWLLELARLAPLKTRLPGLLEPDEIARAARFRFEEDRDRFRLCRAAARIVLARYVGLPAARLRFGRGTHGKPHLLDETDARLEFNLAHSGGLGILAVAGRAVGVDVERIDAGHSGDDVARRFFATDEVERLETLPARERVDAFFSCWTRKEAYLKARGDGLALPLESFSVAFGAGAAPALVRSALGRTELARWTLFDLPRLPGYAGALAVEAREARLAFWRFPSGFVVGP